MSLARELVDTTIDTVTGRLGLTNDIDRPLVSAMDGSAVGNHRVDSGGGVSMVYIGMTVEAFGLDSHMVFAFTSPDSAVPHFTVDSVLAGPQYAFHLDLIPRLDPGANLAYLDHCFVPLTDAHEQAQQTDGLERAHLSPRQWQLMSAWMLANRADEDAFRAIFPTVAAYRDHWLDLVENGVPSDVVSGLDDHQLAARDAANRQAIFSPDVDPVWGRVQQLLGPDVTQELLDSLHTAGMA